jgi:hypothetical protein
MSIIRWKSTVSQHTTGKKSLKVSSLTSSLFFLLLPFSIYWKPKLGYRRIQQGTLNKTMRLKGRRRKKKRRKRKNE